MSHETNPDEHIEAMKKQWSAMGIDPNQMMQYMNNAMEMQKNMLDQMTAATGSNPMIQNMMNMFGSANEGSDMLNLFDDAPEVKEDSDLNEEELKAVLCGANVAYNSSQYINTLSTYMPEDDLLEGLESFWDISSREELINTLNWLENSGHKIYFDLIWEKLRTIPKAEWRSAIKSLELQAMVMDNIEPEKLHSYASNILTGYPVLLAGGCFQGKKDPDVTAWDLARAINLCRCGFDINFFSREEALTYIQKYAHTLYSKYDSWKSFSEGYLFGFAMWNGDETGISIRLDEHNTLVTHQKSLWNKISW